MANAASGDENLVPAAVGEVATLSFVDDEEWNKLPKIEILFQLTNSAATATSCVLYRVGLAPTDPHTAGHAKSANFEQTGIATLGNRHKKRGGAIAVRLGLVPPNYAGDGDNLLVLGRKYRVWSEEHGGTSSFRTPPRLDAREEVRLVWVANEGTGSPHGTRPTIRGNITEELPDDRGRLIVRYADPDSGHQQRAEIHDRAFELTVNKMGGELLIGPLIARKHAWLYVKSVTNGTLTLPKDADYIFSKSDFVSCQFKASGDSSRLESVAALGLFLRANSTLAIGGRKLWPGSREKASFDDEQTVVVEAAPGRYIARLYGGETGLAVLSEVTVDVRKRPAKNTFVLDVGRPNM